VQFFAHFVGMAPGDHEGSENLGLLKFRPMFMAIEKDRRANE
jgi:hypothetical protein